MITTSTAALLAVVLLALLVGAAIPVLYQLYLVLKRARALLDTAGPRLVTTLDQVAQTADRLDRIGSALEAQAQPLVPLFKAASVLGRSLAGSGGWFGTAMTVGGAVGPAVAAGVRALFSRTDDRPGTEGHPALRSDKGSDPDNQQPRLTHLGGTP